MPPVIIIKMSPYSSQWSRSVNHPYIYRNSSIRSDEALQRKECRDMAMDRSKDKELRGSGEGQHEDAGPSAANSLMLDQEQV